MTDLAIVLVAFVVMEPVTYLAHRFVMHGLGEALHKSHHVWGRGRGFEANDLYPVMFAAATIMAMAAGVSLPSLRLLLVVVIGVTLYGASYLFVHDLYIHARVVKLPRLAVLERLKDAHRIHHLYGGEPYGMLLPVVPADLRERAARTGRDPFTATASLRQVGTLTRSAKTS